MTCAIDNFNLKFMIDHHSVPYKYVIINSPKVVETNDCFEYLHAHSKHGDVSRCLHLSFEEMHCIHQMCKWNCEMVGAFYLL